MTINRSALVSELERATDLVVEATTAVLNQRDQQGRQALAEARMLLEHVHIGLTLMDLHGDPER